MHAIDYKFAVIEEERGGSGGEDVCDIDEDHYHHYHHHHGHGHGHRDKGAVSILAHSHGGGAKKGSSTYNRTSSSNSGDSSSVNRNGASTENLGGNGGRNKGKESIGDLDNDIVGNDEHTFIIESEEDVLRGGGGMHNVGKDKETKHSNISTYVLEFGLVSHRFHQFFEGIAIGERLQAIFINPRRMPSKQADYIEPTKNKVNPTKPTDVESGANGKLSEQNDSNSGAGSAGQYLQSPIGESGGTSTGDGNIGDSGSSNRKSSIIKYMGAVLYMISTPQSMRAKVWEGLG
ncbi:hypothetical protein AX774_g1419 [Zancudomyces culisetae]|uniref:Uncharacterized protein n=1 Tax=Zancudomyces culisetae TaxID=1213189 RepID=A0A1R1PVR0_ZANCU|nr:hypothetical protein AX774_g1419 [Zancudomyces culisetae]|eukprot:OMH85040.1 hypothetical protein AX774_g1419 [Zancudomyces culisetae]